jgi:hypothetical protein
VLSKAYFIVFLLRCGAHLPSEHMLLIYTVELGKRTEKTCNFRKSRTLIRVNVETHRNEKADVLQQFLVGHQVDFLRMRGMNRVEKDKAEYSSEAINVEKGMGVVLFPCHFVLHVLHFFGYLVVVNVKILCGQD